MADKDKSQTALTVQQRAGALATQAVTRYHKLDGAGRRRFLATVALLAACVAGLVWYATRTDWRTLYAGLDPDDAREMAQELTTAGIPYDVSPEGSALRVPGESLDKARLATTAKGGPRSGRMGFELFDKPNWMGSEFDEKVNYQRALEGELEHTIGTLASVQSARVHLVLPHDPLFTTEERDAKASVVLHLRQRTISADEAEGITNLVASAVDGLDPARVVLVDAAGGALLGKRTGDAALAEHEQELAAKLVETLEPVAGVGNVRASVNVDYDPVAADEVDETYDPAQAVTLSMQRTDQSSGQPVASGIPGTASNAPNAKPPLYPAQNPNEQNMKQESDTYGVSKKVRHTVEAAGKVRRLTAAVLINDRRVVEGKQVKWEPRPADELKRLSDLAATAIGFDATRGDQVSVEEMAFDEDAPGPPQPLGERLLGMADQSETLIRYGAMLAAMLAFFFVVARPALRSLTSTSVARPAAQTAAAQAHLAAEPPARELTPEHVAAESRKLHAQTVFEQVSEHVKREPAQSTRLLESWIRSE
ncbi:MAG TPA: flagellar basal-body MS-ring/collar protein FliF [Acidobacteriaceae bacterium]|jgi:flagellar M-ring protein FliF|nr:flagellar basal-body MS-ring/collar protein FliF [Acidobacteriaceae bacterium]